MILDVSKIVKNHHVISTNLLEKSAKLQVTLRGQQVLNHQTAGREYYLSVLPLDQFLAQREGDVRFSRARIAENEHILVAIDELSLQQKPDLLLAAIGGNRFKSRVDRLFSMNNLDSRKSRSTRFERRASSCALGHVARASNARNCGTRDEPVVPPIRTRP